MSQKTSLLAPLARIESHDLDTGEAGKVSLWHSRSHGRQVLLETTPPLPPKKAKKKKKSQRLAEASQS